MVGLSSTFGVKGRGGSVLAAVVEVWLSSLDPNSWENSTSTLLGCVLIVGRWKMWTWKREGYILRIQKA